MSAQPQWKARESQSHHGVEADAVTFDARGARRGIGQGQVQERRGQLRRFEETGTNVGKLEDVGGKVDEIRDVGGQGQEIVGDDPGGVERDPQLVLGGKQVVIQALDVEKIVEGGLIKQNHFLMEHSVLGLKELHQSGLELHTGQLIHQLARNQAQGEAIEMRWELVPRHQRLGDMILQVHGLCQPLVLQPLQQHQRERPVVMGQRRKVLREVEREAGGFAGLGDGDALGQEAPGSILECLHG